MAKLRVWAGVCSYGRNESERWCFRVASGGSGVVKASGRLKTLALGVWDSRVCSKTFLVLGRTMYGDLFNPACYLIRNAILSGELCFSPTNLGIALMRFTIGVRLGKGISSNGSLANLD